MLGEAFAVGSWFPAQGLVEAFHLAGGGRGRGLGEPVHDAVLPADPVEHHLEAPWVWWRLHSVWRWSHGTTE